MRTVQITFSPTGGTQKVADCIMSGWPAPAARLDLTRHDFPGFALEKDDLALIAVPSYGGRVPALAVQRLSLIHGSQAQCVIVCVYGNRAYEDTLVELQDAAEQAGFRVFAAVAAVAEHSIMHQYAAGRPDQLDRAELTRFGTQILEKFGASDVAGAVSIPGKRPYKKAGGAGLVPKAGKACTACGLCVGNCPAQAISRDSLSTADSKKCISCMRCVVQCPHSARQVNGALVSVAALAIKKACSESCGSAYRNRPPHPPSTPCGNSAGYRLLPH